MTNDPMFALRPLMLVVALSGSLPAIAQSTKLVEDKDVNVRLSIPKDWESRSRDRDVFVETIRSTFKREQFHETG